MNEFARFLTASPVQEIWIAFSFAVMIIPMILLARWYHAGIVKTDGGRRLMRRQNASSPNLHRGLMGAQRNLAEAGSMAADIQAGKYGAHAKSMQKKVYWIVGLWIAANIFCFGLLIWAQEVAKGVTP
jgi:hypothetical protein